MEVPRHGVRAWFVGRFTARTAADAQKVVEAIDMFAGQVRVAEIRMDRTGEGWRGIDPGGVALLVTCALCRAAHLVQRRHVAFLVAHPLTVQSVDDQPFSHPNGRGGRCRFRIAGERFLPVEA